MTEPVGRRERDSCIWALHATTSMCGGLQVIWSVVLSNGTNYLLSIGMPRHITAITWMAGPVCGIFVQPYIAAASDNFESSFGRRRPFIVLGTIGTGFSIVFLAFIKQIVGLLLLSTNEDTQQAITLVLAFTFVWALNFWIQPLQVGIRALIIESISKKQQWRASACASYWVACGSLVGAASGLKSPLQISGLGTWTQFQVLCLIATVALTSTVMVGCGFTREHSAIPSRTKSSTQSPSGILQNLSQAYTGFYRMNTIMRQVMIVQFFSWMAWFPLLYYGSSHASNIFARRDLAASGTAENLAITSVATRIGTLSFFVLSCAMLITSLMINAVRIQSLHSILGLWTASQALYSFSLMGAFFISSWRLYLSFAFFAGVSFSITQYAPFAILGMECASMRDTSIETGVVMGIHNVAIALPQLIAAAVCAPMFIVLSHLELGGSMAWVIVLGIIPSSVAAWRLRRLQSRDGNLVVGSMAM